MSASMMVLDLLRSHYRDDEQAFRTFAFRLARMTKSDGLRKTMLDVLEEGRRRGSAKPPPATRFQQPTVLKPGTSSMLEPLIDVTLDSLLYEDDLRAQIDSIVLELAHRKELEARSKELRPRSRLLFEGPPGNGKTSAGAAIANELGCAAYGVSIPSLVSQWIGETGRNLGTLFDQIESGAVVVFDEIDAIGGRRTDASTSGGAEKNAIVNGLLVLLDRKTDGTLIATTNRADVLDPALLRRFDETLTFPAPSQAQMSQLAGRLEERLKVPPVDLTGCENFDAVTKRVLREARRQAMEEILAEKAAVTEELEEDETESAAL